MITTLVLVVKEVSKELFCGRFVCVDSNGPEVLHKQFFDKTHARCVVQAVNFAVEDLTTSDPPLRFVLLDRTVLELVSQDNISTTTFGRMITKLHNKVYFEMLDVHFAYGDLYTVLGRAAAHVKVW